MPSLGKTAATLTRRQAALRCLVREPQAVNLAWVYAESGCNLGDLQELAEKELIVLFETEIWRDPLANISQTLANPPILTARMPNTANPRRISRMWIRSVWATGRISATGTVIKRSWF